MANEIVADNVDIFNVLIYMYACSYHAVEALRMKFQFWRVLK